MPELSRRSFLGGILAVGAATIVRPAARSLEGIPLEWFGAKPDVPMLWGDGLHDDTAALNALFSGGEFEVSREGLALRRAGMILLDKGNFLVSDTIGVETERVTIMGSAIQASPTFREGADVLHLRPGSSGFSIVGLHIDGAHRAGCAIREESFLGGMIISPYIERSPQDWHCQPTAQTIVWGGYTERA